MRTIRAIIVIATMLLAAGPSYASEWNRHDELTKAIADARKHRLLTRKESASLRRSLAKIKKLKEELKSHNVREFTSDDKEILAREFQKVSDELQRLVANHSKQAQ